MRRVIREKKQSLRARLGGKGLQRARTDGGHITAAKGKAGRNWRSNWRSRAGL